MQTTLKPTERIVSPRRVTTRSFGLWAMLLLTAAAPMNLLAEANYVYHVRTAADPGCGGNYVTTLNPSSAQTYPLRFKVECQFFTDRLRVYYTTDGSTPGGTFGSGNVGTLVVSGSYVCTFFDPTPNCTVDVAEAVIPAQPAGTVVKYIVSAYHSGGQDEIFGNGCGNCGTENSSSALATVQQYTVGSTTDLYWDSNSATSGAGATPTGTWGTSLFWSTVFDGTAATAGWTAGRNAIFSAGTDAVNAYTVTLGAAQTASGVTVEDGAVSLAGSALTVGGGTVTVSSSALLSIPSTLNLVATAGANLNLNGGTFRGTMNGAGSTFVDADFSINVGAAGGTVETANTAANSSIFAGTIKGSGNTLTKTGSGEFRYQGTGLPNTTFGKLVVNQGLYRLGFASSTSDERGFGAVPASVTPDAITLSGGASIGTSFAAANSVLHANRGLTLGTGGGAINGSMTIPGSITGSGDLSHLTTGTLVLSGANTYSGITFVTLGIVQPTVPSALGTAAGDTRVASGAEVRFDGAASTFTINEPFQIAGPGGGGGGAITVQNAANVTIGGPVTLTDNATNTVSGTATVLYNNPNAITSLANQNLTLQGGALSSGNGGTISGVINLGSGGLTKLQGGRWTLSAANIYSGPTLVSAGRLRVANTTGSATGSGDVTVNSGATLSGHGSIAGAVILSGTIAPGASPGVLITGSETWNGGGTYEWEVNGFNGFAGANWDYLFISGALTINATPSSKFNISIKSLDLDNNVNPAGGYSPALDYTITIASASGGITGFDPAAFNVNTNGFLNPVAGLLVLVENVGNDINLRFVHPPTITCPGAFVQNTDPGLCTSAVTWTTPTTGTAPVDVLCKVSGGVLPVNTPVASPYNFPKGSTMVTCTATNLYGTNACTFSVTVNDTEAPVFNCGQNETVSCMQGWGFTFPIITDNCDGLISGNGVPISITTNFTCGYTFIATRIWQVTDSSANTTYCTQVVTYVDFIAPTITACPTNLTVPCLSGVPAPDISLVTATNMFDPCDTNPPVVTHFSDVTSGMNPAIITRTYRATDQCGNFAQCVQTITVPADTNAPVITLNGSATTNVCMGDTYVELGATATDACDGTITVVVSGDTVNTAVPGTYVVRFNASDTHANAATEVTRTVTVGAAPSFTACPSGTITQTNDLGTCVGTVTWTTAASGSPTPFIQCKVSGGVLPVNLEVTSPYAFPKGTTMVTCSATNLCGSTTCSFSVTVNDTEAPVFNCGQNETVSCMQGWGFTFPIITDNCDGLISGNGVPISTTTNFTCGYTFIATRIWQVTDSSANTTYCTQVVTYVDFIAPTITACPANLTVECLALVPAPNTALVTATHQFDPCETNAPLVQHFSDVTNGINPIVITRTYRAYDACSNAAQCVQTITVQDLTPPALPACPASFSLLATGPSGAVAIYAAPTATDCTPANPAVACNPPSGSTFPVGPTTVTCSAMDAAMNSTNCMFQITVTNAVGPLTLQQLIDAANPGDTVVAPAGHHAGVIINKNLTLDCTAGGVVITGASPALTVTMGTVNVNGGTFTTATDAPTILVTGGSLKMRNALIEESSGFNQVGISVTGGTLDLGTAGDLGGNTVKITMAGSLLSNGTATAIPALGNTFKQDGANITSNFTIEDEIFHRLDDATKGLVTYVANNVYVTTGSGSIQRGVDAIAAGDTVNVAPGTYDELVTINKNLSLLSSGGRAVTTIQNTAGTGIGTVVVVGPTTGVQIGDVNQGFTIIGTDGPPGIEEAGVYFQFNHSNAKVIGNEIMAAGDAALTTEFGGAITNLMVTDNVFSGQSFIGANPNDVGFGNQFTATNVPRQGVLIGGGSGGGSHSNITFTCNVITTITGGLNPTNAQQGNTLVTIDAHGSTIQYNTFAGVSARFAESLRARGPRATISGNIFSGGTPVGINIGAPAAATAHVNNNNIAATFPLAALASAGAAQLDAQSNWWGHASGPTIASNPGGTGGIVAGNVDFSPWLGEATDTSGACGFQPNDANIAYAPATLTFNVQPGGALQGNSLSPQPIVQVLDENGGNATQFQGAVTLSIGINPGGGTLGGVASVNAVNGIATFAGLSINNAGAGYTLVATVTSLPTTTSTAFDIAFPAPVLTTIAPTFVVVGSSGITLTANGSGFVPGSVVHWNGSPRATTFVSASQLTAAITMADLSALASVPVTVVTPMPGGGTSGAQTFQVLAAPAVVYVDDDFTPLSAGGHVWGYDAFTNINQAITAVAPAGTVNVAAGTYREDVLVNKVVSVLGAGIDQAFVVGVSNNVQSSTFRLAAAGALIEGFTITREGNTVAEWNIPSLNSAGAAIQTIGGATIRGCRFVGNRTAIDINNSAANVIANNIITNNRSGILLRNPFINSVITGNVINDNWTIGVLIIPGGLGEDGTGAIITSNSIAGNWYAEVENRSTLGGLKNFSGNWLGSAVLTFANVNGGEPGYPAQIPVAFGGAAVPPGGAPSLKGTALGDLDYTPWLHVGTDTSAATGFQGDFDTVHVDDNSPQVGLIGRIQEGVNLVSGSTVLVSPGSYVENVVIASHVNVLGSGSGNNPAVDSIVTAANAALPVFSIVDAGGANASDRLRIESLRLLSGTSGLAVRSTSGTHEFYQFSNVAAVNNSFSGLDLGGTATLGNVLITGSTITNNGVFGVQLTNSLSLFSGLELSGSTVSDNGSLGLGIYGTDANAASPTGIRVSNSTFARNGSPASVGDGDVTFFKFNGDASLENVTISGDSQFPLQFRGKGTASPGTWASSGMIGLTNVVINGTTARPGLYIVLYSDVTGITFASVDLIGHVAPLLPSGFASAMQVIHSGTVPLQLGSLKLPSRLVLSGTNIIGGSGALAMLGTGGAVAGCDTVISNAYTPMLKELATYDFNDNSAVGDVVFPAFSITATSGNITNECAGPAGRVVSFTVNATSDCTVTNIACTSASGSLFAQGVTTVNCVAYDSAGNSNATSFVVAIIDTTAPVITCPAHVTVNANVGQCFATGVTLGMATAVDLCDGASVSNNAPAQFSVGTNLVVWTAYDVHGNSTTCTQLVTVREHIAPVIACPVDLTVQCDVPLTPANTGAATATDNCDLTPVLTYLDTLAVNVSSNNLDGWAIFTSGVPLTAIGQLINGPATPPAGTGSFRASVGNNGENNVEIRSSGYSGVMLSNVTELNYRTYRTTDGAGLNKAVYLTLNIDSDGNGFGDDVISFEPEYQNGGNPLLPNQGPTQTGVWQTWNALSGGWGSQNHPNLLSAGTNVQTLATYIAAFPNARIVNSPSGGGVRLGAGGGSGVWDNFDGNADRAVLGTNGVSTSYNFEQNTPAACSFIVSRTWKAADGSGNASYCTQLISVQDTTAPAITCPGDITLANTPGVCGRIVSYTTTATDNCSSNVTLVCTPASGSLFAVGTNGVTCRADDGCGNTNICSFNVIINDTEAPSLVSCAPAQIQLVDSSCLSALSNLTGLVTATDNCAVASITQSPLAGTLLAIGVHPVTLTVTDTSGNTTNCIALVTVREADAPTILSCAPPQIILLTNVCTTLLPDYTALVSATNHCGGVIITQSPAPGTLLGIGVTNIVFTVINSSSNSTTCGTTVTIRDTIAPVITCPASFVFKVGNSTTGGVVNFTVTATDECDTTPTVVCAPASGSFLPIGNTVVSCSAVDDSGNTNVCSFTVTVLMATDTCVTVGVTIPDANLNGLASTKIVSTPMGILTDVNVTLNISNGWNGDLYAYLVHSSGFSVLLNRVGATALTPLGYGDPGFNVTLDDQAANGDIHLYRATLGNPFAPLGGPLTGSWAPDARSANPSVVTDASLRTDFLSSFNGLNPNGEWTLFIADVEGGDESILMSWCLNLCGLPPIAPSITTQPLSQTIECSSNVTFTVTTTGTAPLTNQWYFGGTPIPGATNLMLTIASASLAQSGQYTFVVCNMAGCVTSAPAVLTVQDTRAPLLACSTNRIVECATPAGTVVTFTTPATDDCDAMLTVVCNPASGSVFPPGLTTVNCLVADVSGNSNSCSFTISIVDRTAPVLCVAPPVVSSYGTLDNFAGPEASEPGANLLLRVIGLDLRGFDTNLVDAWFVHTITNVPLFAAEATLRIKMRAVSGETTNDTITLGFAGSGGTLLPPQWSRRLGQVGTDPGLTGSPWTPGLTNEFVLNLGALPNFGGAPTDFMAAIRSYGRLDILIQDDTDIDSIVFEVKVCPCQANLFVDATPGLCGTNVTYPAPAFTDACDASLTILCLPPSGSFFAVGATEVACAAIDDSGNSNRCSFTITVRDTQAPTITCPAAIMVNASGPGCASSVAYTATVSDNCGSATLACVPPSGSTFVVGTNTVLCTAADANGNTNSCSFTVTVRPAADLSVTVAASPNPVVVGHELLYTVTISNQGPCLATGITLSNLLSPGQMLVRVTNGTGSLGMACPAPAPLAWWRAEGNASDSAGANHGTLNGGVTFVPGEVGQAFQFDGVNDYVSVPDAPALRPASFTIEGWVKIQDPNGVHVVVSKPKGASSADSYSIWIASGVLFAAVSDNAGSGQFLTYPELPTSSLFAFADIVDLQSLANKLKTPAPADLVSQFISNNLSATTRTMLAAYVSGPDAALQRRLVGDLNNIIESGVIYTPARFAGVTLSAETQYVLGRNPVGPDLVRLNRLLIRDTYPSEIAMNLFPQLNQRYHIAYSFDDVTKVQALYINGALVDMTVVNKTIAYDSHALLIGADDDNGNPSSFFQGDVDELTLYGRALSGTEIESIHRADGGGKCPTPGAYPIGNLASGTSHTVTLVVVPTNCVTVSATASATTTSTDLNAVNNTASASSTVQDISNSQLILTIVKVSPNSQLLEICWPTICGPYELQATGDLTLPITWTTVAVPVQVIGNKNCTIVQPSDSMRYFRLRRP